MKDKTQWKDENMVRQGNTDYGNNVSKYLWT